MTHEVAICLDHSVTYELAFQLTCKVGAYVGCRQRGSSLGFGTAPVPCSNYE